MNGLDYTILPDGTLALTGYSGGRSALVIPEEIGGRRVTALADHAFCAGPERLRRVIFPESLRRIGDFSFHGCKRLDTAVFPGVTGVGEHVFVEHIVADITDGEEEVLEWDELPPGIRFITPRGSALWHHFHGDSEGGSPHLRDAAAFRLSPQGLLWERQAGDTARIWGWFGTAEDLVIPAELEGARVTSIREYAFRGSEALRRVVFPAGLRAIGHDAFRGCSALTEVVTAEAEAEAGKEPPQTEPGILCPRAFWGCGRLARAALPAGMVHLEHAAFRDCAALAEVILPPDTAYLGAFLFAGCTALRTLDVPDGVSRMMPHTFAECPNLTLRVSPGSRAALCCRDLSFPFVPR